jgi:hypothetical protein
MSPKGELRILTGPDAWVPENRELRLARPAGLAIDRNGDLYVADAASYAVRKLSPPLRPGDPASYRARCRKAWRSSDLPTPHIVPFYPAKDDARLLARIRRRENLI